MGGDKSEQKERGKQTDGKKRRPSRLEFTGTGQESALSPTALEFTFGISETLTSTSTSSPLLTSRPPRTPRTPRSAPHAPVTPTVKPPYQSDPFISEEDEVEGETRKWTASLFCEPHVNFDFNLTSRPRAAPRFAILIVALVLARISIVAWGHCHKGFTEHEGHNSRDFTCFYHALCTIGVSAPFSPHCDPRKYHCAHTCCTWNAKTSDPQWQTLTMSSQGRNMKTSRRS